MEGGELFSRIQERGDQAFTERGMYMQLDWELGLRWIRQFLCDAGQDSAPLCASVSPAELKGFCESVTHCQG